MQLRYNLLLNLVSKENLKVILMFSYYLLIYFHMFSKVPLSSFVKSIRDFNFLSLYT